MAELDKNALNELELEGVAGGDYKDVLQNGSTYYRCPSCLGPVEPDVLPSSPGYPPVPYWECTRCGKRTVCVDFNDVSGLKALTLHGPGETAE